MLTDGQRRYREYLKSEHWQKFKASKKAKKKVCPGCAQHKPVQLHHMLYRGDPLRTVLKDLTPLCGECHRLFHDIVGLQVPADMQRNRAWLRAFTKHLLRYVHWQRGTWNHPEPPSMTAPSAWEAMEFYRSKVK